MATEMPPEDAEPPSTEDTDKSSDEAVGSDDEVPKEKVKVCPSLIHDNRLQRSLLQLEDEEELNEAAVEAHSLSLNLIKFMGDMCGWVPDPSVQHRRQPVEKHPPKAGKTKPDGAGRLSASRRFQRSTHGQNHQTAATPDFEFKHYSNIKKYSEQYRRYHTCGGPLQKLTHSAFGRSRTIYYAGDATADAGVEVGGIVTRTQQPPNRPGLGHGANVARGSTEVPNSNNQPPVTYSDISVNSPRYNLLADTGQQRKRPPSINWTHLQKNGAGHPGGQPWNIGMNDQTLTVYTSRAPALPSPHHTPAASSSSPPKPHLPFFPSQQPLKQLQTSTTRMTPPGSNPTNDLLHSGFSLDKTLGYHVFRTPVTSSSTGISLKPGPHRDFYSQLMHAANCLRLANNYSSSDFEFELPRWPTFTMHHDVTTTASQHKTPGKKSPQSTPPPQQPNVQVHIKGRGVSTPPTHTTKSASQLHATKRHTASSKTTPVYTIADPTSATKETHFITIEAPTCSPFDVRSAPAHAKRTSPEVNKTSYRVTLKEKPVEVPSSMVEDSSPVDMVANSNRPIAVCEVTWY
ncbi:uncharacterized protein [Asterias amurensis]|uniref:uncharacterized protein isoform X1 n=1 Tax=Asterias amurensis TaxID=7602 RepID=UPI003AB65FD5